MKKFKQLNQDEMKNVVGGKWQPPPSCPDPGTVLQSCSNILGQGGANFCGCFPAGMTGCTPDPDCIGA